MELIMKLLKLLVLSSALALSIPAGRAFAVDPPEPDSIVVLAKHTQAKPTDPVHVQFTSFKVTKASFDPKKIEGGKATIEIDATSLKSDSEKRDTHLKTPDFLDTSKFPKITIDVDKVKKKADKTFTAEATVKFHDVTKKYPVTFDVVGQTADSTRIKSEVKFARLGFNVGKDAKDPPAQNELVIQMALTLKKT
jgi:polyisoprenoid-binding protein YceI